MHACSDLPNYRQSVRVVIIAAYCDAVINIKMAILYSGDVEKFQIRSLNPGAAE